MSLTVCFSFLAVIILGCSKHYLQDNLLDLKLLHLILIPAEESKKVVEMGEIQLDNLHRWAGTILSHSLRDNENENLDGNFIYQTYDSLFHTFSNAALSFSICLASWGSTLRYVCHFV